MNRLCALLAIVALAWAAAESSAPGVTLHAIVAYESVIQNADLPQQIDAAIKAVTP